MRAAFANYHPAVNFIYFTLVLLFSMFLMHPACLVISLSGAFVYSIHLNGRRAVRFNFFLLLPLLLVTALVNPAFNHEGATILTYFPNGNPLTQESILYGLAAAAMFVTVICWFSCYHQVMTSDKFVYLFGRVIPAMSLLLSMTLRFVPRFKSQFKIVQNAQRCIGRDVSAGTLWQRLRHGATIISIMVTWALENAIDTADAMNSRGYGLPGRSAFSIFKWQRRDKKALAVVVGCGGYLLLGSALGGLYWRYFPTTTGVVGTVFHLTLLAAYALLCAVPVIIDCWEERQWKATQLQV